MTRTPLSRNFILPAAAILLIALGAPVQRASAQTDETPSATSHNTQAETVQMPSATADNELEPVSMADQMPTFQGGDLNTFNRWVSMQMRYPQAAMENGIQGRVLVSFVVETDGTLSSLEIASSPDQSLSDEVLRILRTSPDWTPGIQDGKLVRVRFVLPIIFRL